MSLAAATLLLLLAPQATLVHSMLPKISIKGKSLVFPNGTHFQPRGVNLGGWLAPEDWLCGLQNVTMPALGRNQFGVQWKLDSRFGEAKSESLMSLWYDNFLTEQDLDSIKKDLTWVNVIRVPINYRVFQTRNGAWKTKKGTTAIDWGRLDWIVNKAAARGMYTIPVLHVWQGLVEDGDKERKTISENDPGMNQTLPTLQRQQASEFLRQLALHLKGNTNILAIDSLNEPTGSWGNKLQQVLYPAVRSGDPNVPIILEFIDRVNPDDYGWKNVIYSDHNYPSSADDLQTFKSNLQSYVSSNYNIPFLVGEFHVNSADTFRNAVKAMEALGMGWFDWTFLGVDVGNWVYRNYPREIAVDIGSDSYDTIQRVWSNFRKNASQRNTGKVWTLDPPEKFSNP